MTTHILKNRVRSLNEHVCGNNRLFAFGAVLFTNGGKRIILGDAIAEGGKGAVRTVRLDGGATSMVAKLYHPAHRVRWCEPKGTYILD